MIDPVLKFKINAEYFDIYIFISVLIASICLFFSKYSIFGKKIKFKEKFFFILILFGLVFNEFLFSHNFQNRKFYLKIPITSIFITALSTYLFFRLLEKKEISISSTIFYYIQLYFWMSLVYFLNPIAAIE